MNPERPILRYFGGKWILAPWIISHFPPHRIYVEPFGGAASVLMRKPRSYAEVYNDLDGEIVGFFRILQDLATSAELERRLRLTPFARDEFDNAYTEPKDAIDRARFLVIRAFMGFGSDGHNPDSGKTGFRANSNRLGTTPAHDWINWPDEIKRFTARLEGVVIENRDAKEVMRQQDSPETLHFVDPPYVHATRGAKHSYRCEMTNEQHEELCDFLKTLKGMVVLCGYDHPIYERIGWETVRREAHADGARDRIEVLWLNPAAVKAQAQQSLFEGHI
jgi:DNA adenine methylase